MNWQPGDDFYIRFTDKTGDPRSKARLMEMVAQIQSIAAETGFSVLICDNWQTSREVAFEEQKFINTIEQSIPSNVLQVGKERLAQARLGTIDYVAKLFYDALREMGAEKEATELYEFYQQLAA